MLRSEIHVWNKGSESRSEIWSSRRELADLISCDDVEIVITSSAFVSE